MGNKFIDISEHNTILSLLAIASCDLAGVIMKSTEGTTYNDGAMLINYDALHGKIPIGFYHYLTVTSSPITQAQSFYNRIKDKQYQILPVLDVEQDSLGYKAELYASQFINEFTRLSGQTMMLYSGRCFIEEHFSVGFRKQFIWWVAEYKVSAPKAINGCQMVAWQYTSDSREYAFTNGDLDVSVIYHGEPMFLKQPTITINNLKGSVIMNPMLKGEVSKRVKLLQHIFNAILGTNLETATGIFGDETEKIVIHYQENTGLTPDGKAGENTINTLLTDLRVNYFQLK